MVESKKFDELYPELSPSLHVKTSYEYEVDEANVDEDVATTNQNDSNSTLSVHADVHNFELPQHRIVDVEGNIHTNDERVTYSKLQHLSS